jgi:hypothetical protein
MLIRFRTSVLLQFDELHNFGVVIIEQLCVVVD